jgi:hypothetical protein
MRLVSLVCSFLVTVSLTAVALACVPDYVGQQRIYVDGPDSSSDHQPYYSYGSLAEANPDTAQTATGDSDPYHQRYYSESEGWTYYTLRSYSSKN